MGGPRYNAFSLRQSFRTTSIPLAMFVGVPSSKICMDSYGSYYLDCLVSIQNLCHHSTQSTVVASEMGLDLIVLHQHHIRGAFDHVSIPCA